MILYVGSYAAATTYFADQIVWIPHFYRDYNYHGFKSVADYLNHNDNFRELLILQVFSLSVASVMYFAAGCLGYGARAVVGQMKRKPVHNSQP